MPVFRIISGECNLRNQSGQVRVFHSPRRGGAGTAEVFLDKASKVGPATHVVRPLGTPRFFSSVTGLLAKIVGTAVEANYQIAEGEVIKVFVDTRNSLGKRFKRGCVYLQARENAAHRVLSFKVVDHASATFDRGVIEGRFDILNVEEVEGLGIRIAPQFKALCAPSVVRRLITEDVEVMPEKAPRVRIEKVVLEGKGGEKKEVFMQARKKRRIGGI